VGTINPVRIRLRFADLDTFVVKFAPNVTRGGLFLASRNIQPVGEVITFEVQLMTGAVALAGQGKVSWVKEFNPAEPHRPYGMGVQFMSVEPATRPILARILRLKEKEPGAAGPRGFTGPQTTLAAAGGGTAANGRAPAVDTTVDLAGEYGISEAALRAAMDRRRVNVARVDGKVDDDLSDLLKPEPQEAANLIQALAELPRLLDPQYSRRRAAGGFRGIEPSGPVAASVDVVADSDRGVSDPGSEPAPEPSVGAPASERTKVDEGSSEAVAATVDAVADSGPSASEPDSAPTPEASHGEPASERTNQVDDQTPMAMAAEGAVTTPKPSGSRRSRRRRS